MEISNLPDTEFKIMVIMMLIKLRIMDEQRGNFNRDRKYTHKKIRAIKNTVGGIEQIKEAEEQMSNLKDRVVEIIQMNRKKRIKNEDRLRNLWDTSSILKITF